MLLAKASHSVYTIQYVDFQRERVREPINGALFNKAA